jgi:hypothetical protein
MKSINRMQRYVLKMMTQIVIFITATTEDKGRNSPEMMPKNRGRDFASVEMGKRQPKLPCR